MVVTLEETYSGIHFKDRDFSGLDLRNKKLNRSIFHNCNFDLADLSGADCSESDFIGSTFRKSVCRNTNFAHSKLGGTVFEPDDAYGITLTLECKTFENMHVSQMWWYGWLMFGTLLLPAKRPVTENLRDMLIGAIGAERYVKLQRMFQQREY